jgi:hypothetical protein
MRHPNPFVPLCLCRLILPDWLCFARPASHTRLSLRAQRSNLPPLDLQSATAFSRLEVTPFLITTCDRIGFVSHTRSCVIPIPLSLCAFATLPLPELVLFPHPADSSHSLSPASSQLALRLRLYSDRYVDTIHARRFCVKQNPGTRPESHWLRMDAERVEGAFGCNRCLCSRKKRKRVKERTSAVCSHHCSSFAFSVCCGSTPTVNN